jgi:hypothetical protein
VLIINEVIGEKVTFFENQAHQVHEGESPQKEASLIKGLPEPVQIE